MYIGTQLGHQTDEEMQVLSQLGVLNVDETPPTPWKEWTTAMLMQMKERWAQHGISMEMIHIPLGSRRAYDMEAGAIFLKPSDERARTAVDEWLFWQVGGLGPMLGQAHHFRIYAQDKIPYAIERFTEEAKRLYGVLDRRLAAHEYLADAYSIADIAALTWAKFHGKQGIELDGHPNVRRWLDALLARPAVQRGLAAI